MSRLARTFFPLLTFVLFLAAWAAAAYWLRPESEGGIVVLPGPLAVFGSLEELFFEHEFHKDIFKSILRIVLGVTCSTIPAFLLSILFGLNRTLYSAASPLFAFAKYVPPVSLIPILIVWIGIGLGPQIALLFIGTFFYLTVMMTETVASTPVTYRDAAKTLGARGWRLVWSVYIQHSIPAFIDHLRTMLGIAWTYLVAVEMVAAQDGIGRVIINSQRYLHTGRVLAGVVTIGLLGIVFDEILQWCRWYFCRWKRDDAPLLLRCVKWARTALFSVWFRDKSPT